MGRNKVCVVVHTNNDGAGNQGGRNNKVATAIKMAHYLVLANQAGKRERPRVRLWR